MSVIKRGNSKYWYIQFQMNGQSFIRSSRTTNKKAAEQMEVDWKSKMHAQQYLGIKPSITLGEALDAHCEQHEGNPGHATMRSSAKTVFRLIGRTRRLEDLTSHELERFKRTRMAEGMSQQTIRHNLQVIRAAMKRAKALGYAVSDLVFPATTLPRASLRYLTSEEERRLLAELDPQRPTAGLPAPNHRHEEWRRARQDNYDLVVILLDTGARYSEIAGIEWSRIDLEGRSIRLWRSKVQNESILFMTDRVYDILLRRRASGGGTYVFTNLAGGARGYRVRAIREAIKRAGLIGVKVHTLRHTHASRLIQNGLSVYEVQNVLGHTDIKTTMRYAHLEAKHVTAKARDVINRLNQTSTSSVVPMTHLG